MSALVRYFKNIRTRIYIADHAIKVTVAEAAKLCFHEQLPFGQGDVPELSHCDGFAEFEFMAFFFMVPRFPVAGGLPRDIEAAV